MERFPTENVFEVLASKDSRTINDSSKRATSMDGVMRGVISEFDQTTGSIQIMVPQLSLLEPMVARSTVPITQKDVGREVLVVFESGETKTPFIVGLLWNQEHNPPAQTKSITAKVDGEQVVIEGKKEIVLKCGKSSITLTKAGKILIRGAYLSSRSSGVNRLKGGSVQLN
ncbi:MAG: hypothetical protein NPIRA01_08220 [Nitrospirales bacterium]|nr:MAG: hypothetical protein NPIRA01_08220 [Nitrospirales bacterium]